MTRPPNLTRHPVIHDPAAQDPVTRFRSTATRHRQGFTLTELLISMAVFGLLGVIAFGIYGSTVKLVGTDQGRINTNQNLRTTLDLITQDLREAGESISPNYQISGVDFAPDTDSLTIRKGLTLPVLNVCATFSNNPGTIRVIGQPVGASAATTPAGCAYSDVGSPASATTPNNVSDLIDAWMTYKNLPGNTYIPAILYDPSTRQATRIQISAIANTYSNGTGTSTLTLSPYTNSNSFSYSTGSVIVPVDERRYYRVGDELRLIVNEDPATVQSLGYGLADVQFNAITTTYSNGTAVNTNNAGFSVTSPWDSVSRIDLTLIGNNAVAGSNPVNRTITTSIFPRNVIQAQ